MNRLILFILGTLCTVLGTQAQKSLNTEGITGAQLIAIQEASEASKKWLEELKTPGVSVLDDTMIFSEEARRLMKDEVYRASVYKEQYTMGDLRESFAKVEIQKAFWQLITMYPGNEQGVLKFIYAYDDALPTDEVVLASFYTYAFFDPKITRIENGSPNIYRPDIFEEYFRRTKEIMNYIKYFRTENAKSNP